MEKSEPKEIFFFKIDGEIIKLAWKKQSRQDKWNEISVYVLDYMHLHMHVCICAFINAIYIFINIYTNNI